MSGDPVLSPPRILRIWLSPWQDQDGDLRDQSYLYVMWDRGEWNIQHSRSKIMNQYAPVSLLPNPGLGFLDDRQGDPAAGSAVHR